MPASLLALAAAVAVLALVTASAGLFVSSAGAAAVGDELARELPRRTGIAVRSYGAFDASLVGEIDGMLREEVGPVGELGDPRLTLVGSPGMRLSAGGEAVRVRFMGRDGATEQLTPVSDFGQEGVWIPDNLLPEGLDTPAVTIEFSDMELEVPVAGTFVDLRAVPLNDYWSQVSGYIACRETASGTECPNPLVVAEPATIARYGEELEDLAEAFWVAPLSAESLSLEHARALSRSYAGLERTMRDPEEPLAEALDEFGEFSGSLVVDSSLGGVVGRAQETLDALEPQVIALSMAGRVAALVVVGAAAVFRVRQRRSEVRLLAAQGVAPLGQGARAMAETALAAGIGAYAGLVAAAAIVRRLGPSTQLSDTVLAAARIEVGISALVAVGAIGVATTLAAMAASRLEHVRARRVLARFPWELLVLALAAASLVQALSSPPEGPTRDVLLLAFPILFIAGAGALLLRLASERLLPRLRGKGASWPLPAYLALRQLTAAGNAVVMLIGVIALAAGLFVYAQTVVASTATSVVRKAAVSNGSDAAAEFARGTVVSGALPDGATVVGQFSGQLVPGDIDVDVLTVDTATFAGAARWDSRFSDTALETLLERIQAGGDPLPVVAVGQRLPGEVTLRTTRLTTRVETIGYASAFPGVDSQNPALVVDTERLIAAAEEQATSIRPQFLATPQLWLRGSEAELSQLVAELGVLDAVKDIQTIDTIRARPALRAQIWTFSYLQALGVVVGLLGLVGLVLYLQARQRNREVAYTLARRMGLRPHAHLLAVLLELAAVLIMALLLGSLLALASAWFTIPRQDPLADIPPAAILTWPGAAVAAAAAVFVLIATIGAAAVQRTADRADSGQVLRYG